MGRDVTRAQRADVQHVFQSTRPVWGATIVGVQHIHRNIISIHAPRMGRDPVVVVLAPSAVAISIHAPRMGRDCSHRACYRRAGISIHAPRMGRDGVREGVGAHADISIHAPRMGRDFAGSTGSARRPNFNPRAPYGARLTTRCPSGHRRTFQSTRPVWGATFSSIC